MNAKNAGKSRKRKTKIVSAGGDPVGVACQEADRRIPVEARSWVEKRAESAAAATADSGA